MVKPEKLTVAIVEKALGWSADTWKGNCFAVASQIIKHKLVDGVAVFGMWTGPIHRNSFFQSRLGFTQHGWIVLPDDRVLDPTRWVFEAAKPYIYIGEREENPYVCTCGHVIEEHGNGFFKECECCGCCDFQADEEPWPYDEGANQVNEFYRGSPPAYVTTEKVKVAFKGTAKLIVQDLLKCKPPYSKGQIMWLANAPYDKLGSVKEIYGPIIKAGFGAFIPLDNKLRAERSR